MLGQCFADRYRIEAPLGEGAAASVWRAQDLELDRQVALKVLAPKGDLADPARFAAEARALGKLQHPHLVRCFDAGVEAGRPYLVLELVAGGALDQRLEAAPLDDDEVVRLALQVLDALEAVHAAGVVHRDVKAANVLLDSGGRAKVSDLGLAKFLDCGVRTATGLVVGTPETMAPEVLRGHEPGPASDLFAWGCLVYQMVNRRPLNSGGLEEVLRQRVEGVWERGAERGAVRAAIERALEADPGQRAGAAELRALLEGAAPGAVRGRPAPTPAASQVAPTRLAPRAPEARARGRAPWVALVMLLGLGGGFWLAPVEPDPSPAPAPQVAPVEAPPRGLELAQAWTARASAMPVGGWVSALLADLDLAPQLHYQEAMFQHRAGDTLPGADARLDRIEASLEGRDDFARDAAALADFLADPGQPWAARRDLYHALEGLEHLDAFWVGWGRDPAYGARPVRQALVPVIEVGVRDKGNKVSLTHRLPPAGPLPPGSWTLFDWSPATVEWAEILVADPDDPSPVEESWWRRGRTMGFDPHEHHVVEAEVELGPMAVATTSRRWVEAVLSNTIVPNALQVQLPDLRVVVHASEPWTRRGTWVGHALRELQVLIGVPAGAMREGRNRIAFRLVLPPGAHHVQGLGFHGSKLVLDPGVPLARIQQRDAATLRDLTAVRVAVARAQGQAPQLEVVGELSPRR